MTDIAKLGEVSVVSLLNKRSKAYKELGKELQESDEMAVACFLAVNPKAIIRPLVVENNKLTIGYKPEAKELY